MQITIELTQAQQDAVAVMGKADKITDIAQASFSSRLKGDLLRYRNGNQLPESRYSEATHTVRNAKTGKVVYYKGGLKEAAVAGYNMAKKFLPATVTEATFVNDALAEVDAIIALIDVADTKDAGEENEAGE